MVDADVIVDPGEMDLDEASGRDREEGRDDLAASTSRS